MVHMLLCMQNFGTLQRLNYPLYSNNTRFNADEIINNTVSKF